MPLGRGVALGTKRISRGAVLASRFKEKREPICLFLLAKSEEKEGFFMNKNRKKHIYRITFASLMIAMSVAIGIFCKSFFTYLIYYRLTFENLPIILAGYVLGPVYGAVIAFSADAISCLCSPNPALNPVISLGAVLVGIISGTIPKILKKQSAFVLALSVLISHLVGQVIVKSIGKIIYFGMPWYGIFVGMILSIAAGTVEFILIRTVLRIKSIKKELNKLL